MSTSRTLITGAMLRKPRPAVRKPAAELHQVGSARTLRVVPHPRSVAVMEHGEEPVATNPQFRAPHLGYRRE